MKNLNHKETEILQMIADGETTQKIASQIESTQHAVRKVIERIRRKMEASRTENAVATGIRRGLID